MAHTAPALLLALAVLAGCASEPIAAPGSPDAPRSYLFARHIDAAAELEVAESSRSRPVPSQVPLTQKFTLLTTLDGVDTWHSALPFSRLVQGHSNAAPPPGFRMFQHGPSKLVWHVPNKANTWTMNTASVFVRLPAGSPEPLPGQFSMSYTKAREQELGLSRETAGLSDTGFAARSLPIGADLRHGLYLPAPSVAAWDVTVPEGAELEVEAWHLKPSVQDPKLRSDGAELHIEIEVDGHVVRSRAVELIVGRGRPARLSLADLEGRTVRVRFRTAPGASSDLDYVFLAEPQLFSPTLTPRRLVLLFVDTLRADHLPTYGYERASMPGLAAWSEKAAVFERARSVSPWTLPAQRAVLTGAQPEQWEEAPRLQDVLADHGVRTTALVANAFLSTEFGMGAGWGRYHYAFLASAEKQVDTALAQMQRTTRRDSALLVHFMDPHLPWREPPAYRSLWATPAPPELPGGFSRGKLDALDPSPRRRRVLERYLRDRYDQNLRYLDDHLVRLLDALGDDATVILYSDHGEEFWDHGGLEHGHQLFEELVRVPLILRDPSVPAGRVRAPASLLDLAPTALGLMGLPPNAPAGVDLAPVARGDAASAEELTHRPLAAGRTLRGAEGWTVVKDDQKWISRRGGWRLYDLSSDPHEKSPQRGRHRAEPHAMADALSEALGREVVTVLRIAAPGEDKSWRTRGGSLCLEVEGGAALAWRASSSPEVDPVIRDGVTCIGPDNKPAGLPREVFVLPELPPDEVGWLRLRVREGQKTWAAEWTGDTTPKVLARAGPAKASFDVAWHVEPLPGGVEVPSTHPDLAEQLKVLGYQDEDDLDEPDHDH